MINNDAEQFKKIPQELITHYLDLHEERDRCDLKALREIEEIEAANKQAQSLSNLALKHCYEKMTAISGLEGFDLIRLLPPTRGSVPSWSDKFKPKDQPIF